MPRLTKYYARRKKINQSQYNPNKRNRMVKRYTPKEFNRRFEIFYFARRTSLNPALSLTDAGPVKYGSYTFNLLQLPNATEFTNLFDYYKLTGVKLQFYLNQSIDAQSTTNALYPRMYWKYDYDDDIVPNNLNSLRESPKCKVRTLTPDKPITMFIKPAKLLVAQVQGSITSYQANWNNWSDMSAPDTNHYGIKYAITNFNTNVYNVTVEAKFYFATKTVR